MKITRLSKYAAVIVSVFMVASCAVLYLAATAKPAAERGALPLVSSGIKKTVIEDEPIPLDEFEEAPPEEEFDHFAEFEAAAREMLAGMSEEEKLYQLFFVTPEALLPKYVRIVEAGEATSQALQAQPVGGIIYSSQNFKDAEQTAKMLANAMSYSKIPLFLGVDEEGGRVARISSLESMGFEKIPSMGEIGATGDLHQAMAAGGYIGDMLKALGFNLDFAPVADILTSPANKVIGDRSFGSDPVLAARMTAAFTESIRQCGIAATLKHFPGHGGAEGDTHNGYSTTERTLEEMRESEFLPFISGIEAGADLVMLAHVSAVNVDAEGTPASMSKEIVQLLREELSFRHVIITDALNMGAVTERYDSGEASVQALIAGCDMLLMPENLQEAVEAVREALSSGLLTWSRIDESIVRILAVKMEREIIS